MRTPRPRWTAATALLTTAGALLAGGCGAAADDKAGGTTERPPVVLTMANANGASVELDPFAATVRRLSGGTLQIRFSNDWRKGATNYETAVLRDVEAGKADLAWTGSRALDSVGVTSLDALHAPLLIDSYELERRVLASPVVARMLDGLRAVDVLGLGVLPGPMRKPLGTSPLRGPADYRGRTIAVNRSLVAEAALRALGARPKEIARGGPIDGLDGIEQQIESIGSNEYDRQARYLTANVNLWPRPLVLFMNKATFARLSGRQRAALQAAARAATPATMTALRANESEALGAICRRHTRFVTASAADVGALRRAVQPVYDRLRHDAGTRAAIEQISALRAELGSAARSESAACPRAEAASPGTATPIDGRYGYTLTAAQIRHRGGDESEPVAENYGSFTWVLDRGRYVSTQRNGRARERVTGTYVVAGDTVTFTVAHAAGVYPTGARSKPGEQSSLRWSLFRDELTLAPLKGRVSPAGMWVKPWRRTGDAPRG